MVRLRHKPRKQHLKHHHIVNYIPQAIFSTAMILQSNSLHVICLITEMVNVMQLREMESFFHLRVILL